MAGASTSDIVGYRWVDPMLSACGQPTEDQLRAAAAEGFTVVINLALHDDPRYTLPPIPHEAALARALGLVYVHIPVRFDAPTESDLLAFFDALQAHRGERTLVHCAANRRVTTFLGLYRVLKLQWPPEHAFALMREIWEPDEVWSGFIDRMLAKRAV